MKKLALIALAAGAVVTSTSALAQHRSGGHGPRPGMHGPRMNMQGHRMGMQGHRMGMHQSGVRWNGPRMNHHGGHFVHPGRNFRHHRLNRGFSIHPFWFGPQFHIMNWELYGFADPGVDGRWVRYYDDAYLIDREGRVRDQRYGMDWERYGERWDMDDGIPSYHGRNDYRPGDEDYARDEEDGGPAAGAGWDYRHYGHEGQGATTYVYPPGGYGYYGYGYAHPIIIETTVTTGASYEVVEEVVETRRAHHPRRARPHCACPRPAAPRRAPPRRRPPAGERG